MNFVSVTFLVALILLCLIYYMVPKNKQWITLLVFSIIFYCCFSLKAWIFLLFTAITTYIYAKFFAKSKKLLALTIVVNTCLLFVLKFISTDLGFVMNHGLDRFAFLVPVGISFYTLQTIAYMVDVYKGNIEAENHFFKYLLFIIYFPQILQGPIPRYADLRSKLFKEHFFSEEMFLNGFYLMLFGYFQKMVIADRCNIVVNHIFDHYMQYEGFFLLIAGILYSIQLYTDFAGCVCIAIGCSQMLDIQLQQNFNHPYFSVSIKDFWRRWHISLSTFLRDYIYIPLGGNRKGKFRKYINIVVTFFVSGIWHGMGLHYVIWGLLHAFYQIVGEISKPFKSFCMKITNTEENSFFHILFCRISTFFFVMIAWVFFRAESVKKAIYIVIHMFTKFNPWIFVSGELYKLGITEDEWTLLLLSFICMIVVAVLHEKNVHIREIFYKQSVVFRFIVLLTLIFVILIAGVYGPGYDSAQFIYGGF